MLFKHRQRIAVHLINGKRYLIDVLSQDDRGIEAQAAGLKTHERVFIPWSSVMYVEFEQPILR